MVTDASFLGAMTSCRWLEALKKDKNEIFRAASKASQACDFVLKRERAKVEPEPVVEAAQECLAR